LAEYTFIPQHIIFPDGSITPGLIRVAQCLVNW